MANGTDREEAADNVVNIDSMKKAKPRRERRRFWEGLWRLWPERAYRPWDARPYDFDTYRELRERGRSTR